MKHDHVNLGPTGGILCTDKLRLRSASLRKRTNGRRLGYVRLVPMLLKKSPRKNCRIGIRNNRIRGANFLNRSCALDARLESMLLKAPCQNPFSTASAKSRHSHCSKGTAIRSPRRRGRAASAAVSPIIRPPMLGKAICPHFALPKTTAVRFHPKYSSPPPPLH